MRVRSSGFGGKKKKKKEVGCCCFLSVCGLRRRKEKGWFEEFGSFRRRADSDVTFLKRAGGREGYGILCGSVYCVETLWKCIL